MLYVANCAAGCAFGTGSGSVTVVNGANNSTIATINTGSYPANVVVNPVTNKIYVTNVGPTSADETITIIDGATNSTSTIAINSAIEQAVVNPFLNQIWVVNCGEACDQGANVNGNAIMIAEQQVQSIPLAAAVTPLIGNTTTLLAPTFDFAASSTFGPFTPTPDALYFQADTWLGAWTPATAQGGEIFSGTTAALLPGFHTLYAYSTDGQDATSTTDSSPTGTGTSPLNSNIAAYGFLVAPPTATLAPSSLNLGSEPVGTPSAAQNLTLSSSGASLAITSIAFTGTNSSDFSETNNCGSSLNASSSCTISVIFTPSVAGAESATLTVSDDSGGASGTTQTVSLSGTGTQQTPTITWPTPAAITYGTPLSATQLDATASSAGTPVPGTFAYTPAAGTVLNAGVQTLSVSFTPTDSVTYSTAAQSVTFIVNPAILTVAANNEVMGQGSLGIPALTYSIYGYVIGDTATSVGVGLSGTPLLSTAVTSSSSAGTYPIVTTQGTLALTPPPNYTFAFLNGTLTVSANALNFVDNYFVSGDYVAAGVNLVGSPVTSGMVTGTISIAGVPAGADIVNAFLYWQTVESSTSLPSGSGFFNGYAITGSALEADLPLDSTWNVTGSPCVTTQTCVMRSYRAEVYPMLPRGTNGIYQPNGPQTVQLPAPAQGASLVVIYRVLSGGPGGPAQSQYPLKAVVIHDGAWLPINSSQQMIQTVQGFYDGVIGASANLTTIYSTQAGWAAASKTVQLSSGSQYADTEASGAWSALVFSVLVNSSDNDGLLDVWKVNGGYCDAGVNQGICDPGVDPSWVALTGAVHGKQDLFVQMDYTCSGVVSIGSDGVPTCDISGGGESLLPWVVIQPTMTQDAFLTMVQQPFLNRGINVHFVVGNAVPEEICTTDNPAANLFCMWPGEPGVVGWKSGLEQIKASPRNPASCNTTGGDCTPRFQVGKKDSYHYVLFGHSVSIPSWSIQAGTLSSIQVLSGGWATVTTSATLPDANGNLFCPTRVTIGGALATSGLNGVYNVLPVSGAGSACTFTSTATTFTIQTASPNPAAYPVTPGTYPVPNGLPEPTLAIYNSQTDTTSGYSDVGGGDSTVTLGKFEPTQAQLVNVQAGTLMHELGHTLGLTHGGRYYPNGGNLPAFEPNCKPNYQSVMNYLFQFDLLGTPDASNPYGYLDYSDRALSSLDESNLSPWPGLITPAYPETKWFSSLQPPNDATSVATHCDGTPVGSTESPMWVWDGIPNWSPGSSQDINFDKLISVLDGYSDWDSIDPRQVGAFATDYVDIAALLGNGGGHGATGPGGGGHGATGPGGGGHGATGPGGGGHGATGPGGGGKFNEINYQTAASYPRSPRGLTTTASGTTATISWYGASFGQVQEYIVYGVTSGGTAAIACVYLVSPANCPVGVHLVQAPNPQATSFSYTDTNWSTNETYFVTTVDIGPSGTLRESTPAKQYQAALTLNAPPTVTYGITGNLSTTGGTIGGSVTYDVLSGPCSITGNQLNQLAANSGTGSCVVSATMAGNSSYDAVTSPTATVSLKPANATITVTGYSVPYDGNPHTATGTATGVESPPVNLSSLLTLSGTTHANVGNYTDSWTFAGNNNYNPATGTVADSIGKANANITVTPYSLTYNGNPHTATGTATGVKGESLSGLNLSGTTHTTAGVYNDTWTFTDVTGSYNNANGTVTDTISQSTTATTLTATPNPANFAQAVSLTATVAPVAPGAGTPTGTVKFRDGSTALATVTMSNAAATFTTSSLAAGTHNLTASYSGDANFITSPSATLAEQVICGVLLAISPSTMHWGGSVTVTGQVISCSTTAQTVSVKFTLNGTLQPNKCSSAQSVIFTSPPFTLPAKTSKSVSFPFTIPNGTCTGKYSITATTLVNGTAVNTSTASLTITAH
jgi:YVTN family beta-propeller protein